MAVLISLFVFYSSLLTKLIPNRRALQFVLLYHVMYSILFCCCFAMVLGFFLLSYPKSFQNAYPSISIMCYFIVLKASHALLPTSWWCCNSLHSLLFCTHCCKDNEGVAGIRGCKDASLMSTSCCDGSWQWCCWESIESGQGNVTASTSCPGFGITTAQSGLGGKRP